MRRTAELDGLGVCTNEGCEIAKRRQAIARYPGPGQYCPECGELLSSAPALEDQPAPEPDTTLESLPPTPADAPSHHRTLRLAFIACGAVALIAGAAAAGLTQVIPALSVRVCTSSMTDGIAKDVVDTYSSQHPSWPYHYTVTAPGDLPCDVRFFTAENGHDESMIARDAVVAVVNPQNPIAQLNEDQVRGILNGGIVNWSQLGGRSAKIAADVPGGGSDEAQVLEDRLMPGHALASDVDQTLTAAQIVRLVASPSGAHSIGFVPFSAALPAKVVALAGPPAPSSLSIADQRYPLSLRILAASDFRYPKRPAADLVSFIRSPTARRILLRAGLTAPRGS